MPASAEAGVIDKVVASFDEAVADVESGATVMCGAFANPFNTPSYLIAALARQGASNLTLVAASVGTGREVARLIAASLADVITWPEDYFDPGLLSELGRVSRAITTFPVGTGRGRVWPFERRLERGEVEVEVLGQGSLAERIRAARAGIAAFYTPVGPGTRVAEGKEVRDFEGVPHLLERALPGDVALIRAHRADRFGNLVYRGPRTFNQTMAGAARITIAEVDEVVALGELAPDAIHTPGVYVQRVVQRPLQPVASWEEPC
jgi:3-oxoacid CoA-transferase A subunit